MKSTKQQKPNRLSINQILEVFLSVYFAHASSTSLSMVKYMQMGIHNPTYALEYNS